MVWEWDSVPDQLWSDDSIQVLFLYALGASSLDCYMANAKKTQAAWFPLMVLARALG
jgi:hypothetical protein